MTLLDSVPAGATATGFTIAEVADEVGITAHTLRYYERIGLLEVARDRGGRRVYQDEDVRRLVFITYLRSTNMPISGVQRYFELVDEGPQTEPDRLALLHEHRDNVRRQLDEVQTALAAIEFKIEFYGGNLADCSK